MTQLTRNLLDAHDGFLRGIHYLILERDPLYTATFRRLLRDSGAPLALPDRSPNLKAFAERFVGRSDPSVWRVSCHSENDTFEPPSERSSIIHEERPHQGLGNELLAPKTASIETGPIRCRERLGGMLTFYYSEAA